jgi:hypothetical protein
MHSFFLFSFFRLALSGSRCLQVFRKCNEICSIEVIKRANARKNVHTKETTERFTSCCAPWMISMVHVLVLVMTLYYQINVPACYKWVLFVRSDVILVHYFSSCVPLSAVCTQFYCISCPIHLHFCIVRFYFLTRLFVRRVNLDIPKSRIHYLN